AFKPSPRVHRVDWIFVVKQNFVPPKTSRTSLDQSSSAFASPCQIGTMKLRLPEILDGPTTRRGAIETLRNWAAYSDELAEVCDAISESAGPSYCKSEINSVRGFVLRCRSDRLRDHHSSRYSLGLVPHT